MATKKCRLTLETGALCWGYFTLSSIVFVNSLQTLPIGGSSGGNGDSPIQISGSKDLQIGNLPKSEDARKSDHRFKSKEVQSFYLWTREKGEGVPYEVLNPDDLQTIKESHFSDRKTFVVIHGFLGWGLENWIITLKNELLHRVDCNVISVDWPAGTEWFLPSYYRAAARVEQVGMDTASLVGALLSSGKFTKLENLHLIGHSLGAHAAGFCAKEHGGKVGRISGLDPAGPMFRNDSGGKRLNASDAEYVDIIHSNGCRTWDIVADCFGLMENIGHSDFWPNGGEHQPGCKANGWWARVIKGEIGCDHEMAYIYYTESVKYTENGGSFFLSRPCESWFDFAKGNCTCGISPQFMGFNVDVSLHGIYFLNTNKKAPYAIADRDCLPSVARVGWATICILLAALSLGLVAVAVGVHMGLRKRRRRAGSGLVVSDE